MPPYRLPNRPPTWHPDRNVGPRLTRPDQSPKPQTITPTPNRPKTPSVIPTKLLLSYPQVPLLSFPQVFSGNPSWQRCRSEQRRVIRRPGSVSEWMPDYNRRA